MKDEKTPYVGYMNPPHDTRFKKGKSGNPRGRPRKREDMNTVLQRVLNRKIRIKDDDQRIPIRDALIRKLKELVLQGDKQALALQRRILTDAGYDAPDPTSLEEEEKEIQRQLQKAADAIHRMLRATEEADDR
ncbi:MAG: hypothetical protein HKO95_01115 [Rhodobacteraceae bacterium]|nr:hypothetical protein [Paracoccaceae bacterium]NNK65316.1 hypothetical protein [Paracoccaceae bacterium]